MADTSFFKGWLGPFKLLRRYSSRKPAPGNDELGRIYEAYNVLTHNPALVLIPSERAPMEPEEAWRVCLRSQAEPPYVALEVEKAPASGRLPQLRGMLKLLGIAVERLAKDEEARAHLTCPRMGPLAFLMRQVGRSWRWVRASRWRTVAVCGLMLLSLRLLIHVVERDRYSPYVVHEGAVQPVAESRAPTSVNESVVGSGPIAYPLPAKPFSDQARAPCKTNQDEVEINGGCWVTLERRPPCRENQAEYGGKCYLPVSARSRSPVSVRARSEREYQLLHR